MPSDLHPLTHQELVRALARASQQAAAAPREFVGGRALMPPPLAGFQSAGTIAAAAPPPRRPFVGRLTAADREAAADQVEGLVDANSAKLRHLPRAQREAYREQAAAIARTLAGGSP